MATATVTMIAIVITINGEIAITTGATADDRDRDHHWWERDHRRNDGYYGGGQIYNRYPRGYPGGYGYPSGGLWLSQRWLRLPRRFACYGPGRQAVAETAATTSAIRTAATWRNGHVAEQTIQSQSSQ